MRTFPGNCGLRSALGYFKAAGGGGPAHDLRSGNIRAREGGQRMAQEVGAKEAQLVRNSFCQNAERRQPQSFYLINRPFLLSHIRLCKLTLFQKIREHHFFHSLRFYTLLKSTISSSFFRRYFLIFKDLLSGQKLTESL